MRETFSISLAVAALSVTASCGANAATTSGPAQAATSEPTSKPVETVTTTDYPVVVAATRTATPSNEIASSVTLITDDEIAARQERTLADVLRDVPGVNLVQSGGPGAQAAVFMRGTNSNHTKVLIDGIDVSDPSSTGTTFDFSQMPTQDIERVEVLRGPQSGLYGSDAIGGVINIITKRGYGKPQLSANAEGGSFDTFNQAGSVTGSTEQLNYSQGRPL
jgi:vitamin B12 transporter